MMVYKFAFFFKPGPYVFYLTSSRFWRYISFSSIYLSGRFRRRRIYKFYKFRKLLRIFKRSSSNFKAEVVRNIRTNLNKTLKKKEIKETTKILHSRFFNLKRFIFIKKKKMAFYSKKLKKFPKFRFRKFFRRSFKKPFKR